MSTNSNIDLIRLLKKNIDGEFKYIVFDIFKRHEIDSGDVNELVRQIRVDGSMPIISNFKEPVDYDEIVVDVAKKIGVNVSKIGSGDVRDFEKALLIKVMGRYLDSLQPFQREKILNCIDSVKKNNLICELLMQGSDGLDELSNTYGDKIVSCVIREMLLQDCHAIERNIKYPSNIFLLYMLVAQSFIYELVKEVFSPSFKKTIPTVMQISVLRLFDSK